MKVDDEGMKLRACVDGWGGVPIAAGALGDIVVNTVALFNTIGHKTSVRD